MGRKTISGTRKSERTVRIRVTDEERAALDEAASLAGKPVSTWARDILLAIADRKPKGKPDV